MGMCSTVWTTRPLSLLNGASTGQRTSRNRQQRRPPPLRLRRCGIRGIYSTRSIEQHSIILKPTFCDISQNNHQKRQRHGITPKDIGKNSRRSVLSIILRFTALMEDDSAVHQDGLERFWRNIFGGLASARFHRPDGGIGLNETAQAHIKTMRSLTDKMDIFTCEPHNALLSNRAENSAYAIANPGREYAIYFPSGGSVDINLGAGERTESKTLTIRWLDIGKSEWTRKKKIRFKR